VITEAAEEVLGKTPKKAKKKWISNETMQLIERKRQLRNQRKRSAEYNDLKREVQNALRKDKQEWLEEKCTEVEEMNRRHNTSGVYKTIKEITGKRGMRQMGIKDKYGQILTDDEQVLKRWKTHTENMYSQPEDQSDRRRFLHRRTEDEPTPLVEEV